jgi:hypothetical protein
MKPSTFAAYALGLTLAGEIAAQNASIGVQFISGRDLTAALLSTETAGLPAVAQSNWNTTDSNTSGNTANIAAPTLGSLVDRNGLATPATISWVSQGSWTTANGTAEVDAKLMNGYIDAVGAAGFVTVDFASIPYQFYNVYVYFGSDGNGRTGRIQLEQNATPVRTFSYSTFSNLPGGNPGFQPADYTLTENTATGNPAANYAVFNGIGGPAFTLRILRGSNNSGVHAVQIVETPDADGDTMPNQYEIDNGLNPNFDDRLLDLDQDGVNNITEFINGTKPNDPDTDDDGLGDAAETNTGIYVSPTNAGSNPLVADTDGDGIQDGPEVATGGADLYITDPNKEDTDGDGYTDPYEIAALTNPTLASSNNSTISNLALNINFIGGHSGANEGTVSGPAGVVPLDNWNNVGNQTAPTGLPLDLNDSTGTLRAGTTVGWHSANTWSVIENGTPADANAALMQGYLDTGNDTVTRVTVRNIPFRRYEVIVYFDGDAVGGRAGNYSVTSAAQTATRINISDTANWPVNAGGGTFVEAVGDNSSGNYLRFKGHGGGTAVITATPTTVALARAPISGIQIIGTPDSDGDGMPDEWELLYSLNPNDPSDAAADGDNDFSTNLEEFTRGTLPNNPDTDGDTALDGHETKTGIYVSLTNLGTDPLIADTDGDFLPDGIEATTGPNDPYVTNPTLRDTDGDGLGDGYEVNITLTSPLDNTRPVLGTVKAIGVNFASSRIPGAALGANELAGFWSASQRNWNNPTPGAAAGDAANGSTSSIATPLGGVLVDSTGTATLTQISWTANGTWNTNGNVGNPNAKLMNAYVDNIDVTGFATINFTDIPYASYDVYVYFGSDGNGRTGSIYSSTALQEFFYTTQSNAPNFTFDQFLLTDDINGADGAPPANYCVFRGQSAASFSVQVNRGNSNSGFHAIQIVEAAVTAPVMLSVERNGTEVTFSWTSETGATYSIDRSTTLKDDEWFELTDSWPSNGPETFFTDTVPANAPERYYRVRRN